LLDIRDHPAKLVKGWWRAVSYFWEKNTPFQTAYHHQPAPWFTEIACRSAVFGSLLAIFVAFRCRADLGHLERYRAASWIMLATLAGTISSLAFAPPWDGESRIFAATIPLLFLLSGIGLSGLSILLRKALQMLPPLQTEMVNPACQVATWVGISLGTVLSIIGVVTSYAIIDPSLALGDHSQPAKLMTFAIGQGSIGPFDLRRFRAGYRLNVQPKDTPTWLPNISQRDFASGLPKGSYAKFREKLTRVPAGSTVVALPSWVLLILDSEDARRHQFTPRPDDVGTMVWPPVYFSKGLP